MASWLGLARMVSFGLALVLASVLSRFLPAAEYGTYCQVLYVYTTLLTVFSVGLPKSYSYFLALVPPQQGWSVVKKLNRLFVVLGAVFFVCLYCGAGVFSRLLSNPLLAESLRWFSVTPVFLMPVIGVESVLTVYKMTRLVLVYVLVSRGFTIVCVVAAVVFFNAGLVGAVAGFVVASAVTCLAGLLLMRLPFASLASLDARLPFSAICRFSLPVFKASIYGVVIGSASLFFVGRYFSVEEFAVFSIGFRELPLAEMVVGAAGAVLMPELAAAVSAQGVDRKRYALLCGRAAYKAAAIVYPVSVFCFVFAPDIIVFLFGQKYSDASVLFRIVTAVSVVRILPFGPILFALGKGRAFADAHLITAVLVVGLDMICVRFFPSITGIALVSAGTTVFCLTLLTGLIARTLEAGFDSLVPWRELGKLLFCALFGTVVSKAAIALCGVETSMGALGLGLAVYLASYGLAARFARVGYANIAQSVISMFRNDA